MEAAHLLLGVKRIVTSLGCTAPSLEELYHDLMEMKCKHIQSDPSHPGVQIFKNYHESRLRTIYRHAE